MIDALLGSYRLLHKIGEGGMGTIWVGEHTLLGKRAAIKILQLKLAANESIVQRFFNEAKIIAAIADPGIVQIFDFGVHQDGSPYIVMELLEGEPLDARLQRLGRLPPGDAARFVRQVAMSLAAAHDKGVIHRDLKPENLFAARDPAMPGGERVKVLDFGIAKLSGGSGSSKHKTKTGAVIGTPAYMSPEQCRAIGNIDHRSDIYSLGAVLFCLVAGRPPFEGEGAGDAIIAHVRDQPPVPSSIEPAIPMALDSVILRCLEKDPARRYPSMSELARALEVLEPSMRGAAPAASWPSTHGAPAAAMAMTTPVSTTISDAPGELTLTGRSVRRRWVGLGLGLGGAVAVAIAFAIAFGGGGGSGEGPLPASAAPVGSAAGSASEEPASPAVAGSAAPVGSAAVPDPSAAAAGAAVAVDPSAAAAGPAAAAEPSVAADSVASSDASISDASIPGGESLTMTPDESGSAAAGSATSAEGKPLPRSVQVPKPRDNRRAKEATTRHGPDTKASPGRLGRIDRGD